LTEGDECGEEFERERTAEDVVFIAYGCAFGRIVGCFLLGIGAIGGPEDTVVFAIVDDDDGLLSEQIPCKFPSNKREISFDD
jgi:hypothetical protein